MLAVWTHHGVGMMIYVTELRPIQSEILQKAGRMAEQGDWQGAEDYINQQTLVTANSGTSIQSKYPSKAGGSDEHLARGLRISLEPGPDGKYDIVDACRYCEKQDEYFKEPAVMQNHIKNRCKLIAECPYCK